MTPRPTKDGVIGNGMADTVVGTAHTDKTHIFEELMDVLKRVPSLNNVYHLARMPDTQIGEWESPTVASSASC